MVKILITIIIGLGILGCSKESSNNSVDQNTSTLNKIQKKQASKTKKPLTTSDW